MPRFLIETFGCQMNVHDSRRIEDVLAAHGWTATDDVASADLVLFNTCSVREKAEQKLRSAVGLLREVKDARPSLVIAVAGCVAQQEGEKLLRHLPYVDLVLGPDQASELPALVEAIREGAAPIARTVHDVDAPVFLHARPRPGDVTAFVTVMKGCDERCSFCIVPTTRGPERYRPADDIVAEVRGLVDGGVREVTLLGQTVNSWHPPGEPEGDESQFALLLRRIAAEVPELLRLRYTSPHPRHVTPALIAAHRDLPLLPSHVHLPVQSGSDRILKRMIRRYTRAWYLDRSQALKEAKAGLSLSTDLIVGFPGETEEDFVLTLSLVREVGFVAAFGFKYSPRPGTPSTRLDDDVPEDVKDERLARLFGLVQELQSAHLASLVGRGDEVLVEGRSRDGSGRFVGRSSRHEIVHVDAPAGVDPTGSLVHVTITEAFKHSLLGRMAGAFVPPARRPVRTHLAVAG